MIKSNNIHRKLNGGLDKYYTPFSIAKELTSTVLKECGTDCIFVEPSAGSGVFVDALRSFFDAEVVAMDVEPTKSGILHQDFFEYNHNIGTRKVVVIGNPPFGFKASLAVRFFNKAASFADYIAFILPASFMKDSVKNQLDLGFELVFEQRIKTAFEFPDGGVKIVPCVMQIWKKSDSQRVVLKHIKNFQGSCEFVKEQCNATVAIRRVGSKAGTLLEMTEKLSPSSTYFIKCDDEIEKLIQKLDFTKYVNNTVGVRSLSKSEFWKVLNESITDN